MQKQPTDQLPNTQQQKLTQNKTQEEPTNPILSKLQFAIQTLTQQIKQMLQTQNVNQIQVNGKVKTLLVLQTQFHNIKELFLQTSSEPNSLQEKSQSLEHKIAMIQKESQSYEPTLQEINQKRQSMLEQLNDQGWTDATQSQTGTLGQDGIMVIDDDMLDQMLGKQSSQHQSDEEAQQEEKIDFDELQKEFVTGKQSNQDYLFGQHQDKFCVSVCSVLKEGIVISGGGDDKLHVYNFNKEEYKNQNAIKKQQQATKTQSQTKTEQVVNSTKEQQPGQQQPKQQAQSQQASKSFKSQMIKPHKIISHHETIDLLDLSFDKENVFSLTEKQLICTNLKTLQHTKVEIDPPTIITCHSQGGVFAIANAFNVQIFNIKGFKFYDSYCLDEEVSLLKWTLNGKQLVAACDNKLRIITPKTQEVTKVTGTAFHEGQITTMSLLDNIVFTGCIDGGVFASNISKGQILCGIPKLQATINTLCTAENYLIVGPALNLIHWYDSNKLKQLFTNELNGSSTDIIQLGTKNQYAVSDIQGEIHLFDKRSPMEHKFLLKAGNTVHQIFYDDNVLLAACEDGCVRGWDLRKYQY